MADFNKIYDAGDVDNGIITTVIEISKGSMYKVEWNREKATFELDRVEPGIFKKPTNYGFIPQTIDEDGDELDTLVITEEGLPMGLVVEKARVIGVLNFDDGGEMDHKIVVVPADDRHTGDHHTHHEDLPIGTKTQIEHHFNHYKDLKKPGTTKVLGWGDAEEAKKIIKECQARWDSQIG